MRKILTVALSIVLALGIINVANSQNFPGASGNPTVLSRPGGMLYAPAFFWSGRVISGNSATGSATIIIAGTTGGQGGLQIADGTTVPLQTVFATLTPITVDWGQGNSESVTPTAVSVGTCPSGNIGIGGVVQCASVTASFNNTHGQSAVVVDSTFGLQTAVNYANSLGGGIISIDSAWRQMGGTNALITALVPFANVSIYDTRANAPQFWNVQNGLTTLAAPTALVNNTTITYSTTPAGLYTTANPYFACIAYVDILGQEGPCSGTMSATPATTLSSANFTAPAASTGAVGYTIYISLTNGTYQLAYKVPLITQPTVLGAPVVANGNCILTTLETITPACAVTNTTYGQTGSTASVAALTINTAPVDPQITTVSSTTVDTPNAGGRTTSAYVPGSHMGVTGAPTAFLPYVISAAEATTVPSILGTIDVAPNFMNFVGREIEICGKATTTASTATIVSIQIHYESTLQDTAGLGVKLSSLSVTPVAAFSTTKVITFCQDLQTTVASASGTGGSINPVGGFIATSGVTSVAAGQAAGTDASIGAVGSLNLAADGKFDVVSVHTTGTDGTAMTLQSLSMKVLN